VKESRGKKEQRGGKEREAGGKRPTKDAGRTRKEGKKLITYRNSGEPATGEEEQEWTEPKIVHVEAHGEGSQKGENWMKGQWAPEK